MWMSIIRMDKKEPKRNYQQMGDFNMICLLLEQTKKKYLEIILDDFGCNLIIDNLALLKSNKQMRLDLSKQIAPNFKQGYSKVDIISITYNSNMHIGDTEYNIICIVNQQDEIELSITYDGIQELRDIIEFVRDNDDHFHLFGGFDLCTDEEHPSNNIIDAITIYSTANY